MNCPVCEMPLLREYDIVGSVYDPGTLKDLDLGTRKDVLAIAKRQAIKGTRPRITTYDIRFQMLGRNRRDRLMM
jgi:hypothetical protein